MNTQDNIANAQDADLLTSLAALRRAALQARETAIQTDTGIVIVQDGQLIRVPAQALRETVANASEIPTGSRENK
jgi:hypothetical protein